MDADTRRRERNGAAVVRALGRTPTAEFRSHQLQIHERHVSIATPYLTTLEGDVSPERGVFDAIAVRLRYSDGAFHKAHEPTDLVARLVFDMVEQIRCESLIPDELEGARHNIEAAFRSWCARQDLTSTRLGLLIFTVMHMVRSRLVHPIHDAAIEDEIESTRASISPLIGVALKGLKEHRADQQDFAVPALSLSAAITDLVRGDVESAQRPIETVIKSLFIPPEWGDVEPEDGEAEGALSEQATDRVDARSLDDVGGYHVFTRSYDRETDASTLYSLGVQRSLREALDEQIAAQAVSPFTLARRLQRLLVGVDRDGWRSGEDEGMLDSARLSQIVASPGNRTVFRQERYRPIAPAVVSFLIDNSGSMKRQRHETVTVLVDTLARALDLAGATSEILGFTTASWNGGEPLREWRRAGEPPHPGRLAEVDHIIYKDADTPWKRSRLSVATMMKTQHFREGVDGEAIVWAYKRLLERPEPRKLLVVVSDGAPMEAATMNANGEAFLEAHLRAVGQRIEHDGYVELGAIAIDHPVDAFFSRSVEMDLRGTASLAEYRVLEELFVRRRGV